MAASIRPDIPSLKAKKFLKGALFIRGEGLLIDIFPSIMPRFIISRTGRHKNTSCKAMAHTSVLPIAVNKVKGSPFNSSILLKTPSARMGINMAKINTGKDFFVMLPRKQNKNAQRKTEIYVKSRAADAIIPRI